MVRTASRIPLAVNRTDCRLIDSSQNSLNSIILGLIAFPEVVTKAHEELDRVVADRLPQFEDSPNLPYIRAMVKEVLRWRSVSNDHFAHLSTVKSPTRLPSILPLLT